MRPVKKIKLNHKMTADVNMTRVNEALRTGEITIISNESSDDESSGNESLPDPKLNNGRKRGKKKNNSDDLNFLFSTNDGNVLPGGRLYENPVGFDEDDDEVVPGTSRFSNMENKTKKYRTRMATDFLFDSKQPPITNRRRENEPPPCGYPMAIFKNNPHINLAEYTCASCKMVLRDPYGTDDRECDHKFCFLCYDQLHVCPVCMSERNVVAVTSNERCHHMQDCRLTLASANVICPKRHCTWKGTLKQYDKHTCNIELHAPPPPENDNNEEEVIVIDQPTDDDGDNNNDWYKKRVESAENAVFMLIKQIAKMKTANLKVHDTLWKSNKQLCQNMSVLHGKVKRLESIAALNGISLDDPTTYGPPAISPDAIVPVAMAQVAKTVVPPNIVAEKKILNIDKKKQYPPFRPKPDEDDPSVTCL